MNHAIEIVEYTDPYCTWCWGSEPVLRHLQEAYGDQLTIRFVMGGLVEDSKTFSDPRTESAVATGWSLSRLTGSKHPIDTVCQWT